MRRIRAARKLPGNQSTGPVRPRDARHGDRDSVPAGGAAAEGGDGCPPTPTGTRPTEQARESSEIGSGHRTWRGIDTGDLRPTSDAPPLPPPRGKGPPYASNRIFPD